MSSPLDTPKQTKGLRHFIQEPFRPQSKSPLHSSKPLPPLDPDATAATGSGEDGESITGASTVETTRASITNSSHVDPFENIEAISGALIIVDPNNTSPAVTQLGIRQDIASQDNTSLGDIPRDLAHASRDPWYSDLEHASTGIRIPGSTAQTDDTPILKRSRNVVWDGLRGSLYSRVRGSLQTLKNKTNLLPPLSSVIESLLSCLNGFQEATRNCTDHETLPAELTRLSDSLQQHMNESLLTWMSDSTASAVILIEHQVNNIREKLNCATRGDTREASTDGDELVRHYRRVEAHFRHLQVGELF
ncbi:hypothetical protein RSAG8_08865, partial [Rhizoctonia solani AG-8 WAC10335]